MGRVILTTVLFMVTCYSTQMSLPHLLESPGQGSWELSNIELYRRLEERNFEAALVAGVKSKIDPDSDLALIDGISSVLGERIQSVVISENPIGEKSLKSTLLRIKGIGDKRAKLLMRYIDSN